MKYESGRSSPTATACWNGPLLTKVRNCLVVRVASTSGAGPVAHPTFHPVNEKVLPADEIDSVRSAMPGKVASGRWTWSSKVMCS